MAKKRVSSAKPASFRQKGFVSIWGTIAPLSRVPDDYCVPNYADESKPFSQFSADFQLGYYDLDSSESHGSDGRLRSMRNLLKYISYSSSFIDEAEKAAMAKKLEKSHWVFLLYDFCYDPKVTRISESTYMRFLGTFQYDDSAEPVEKWQSE